MNEQQKPAPQNTRFETDTQKIVHRHLADPTHVITDEEIASIRVGMSPNGDNATEEAIKDGEDRIADTKSIKEDETIPGAQKTTLWDVVD